MESPKVVIGIVSLDFVPLQFLHAVMAMEKPAHAVISTNKKPLDAARNLVVESMPREADYLFFLDSDTIPPANALTRLLSHNLPIVGGLYFRKTPPFDPLLLRHAGGIMYEPIYDFPANGLVEVDATGLGCMLVKREVLDSLGKPWFKFDGDLSEDYYFCRKAKEAGYKIMVDTGVQCDHLGIFPVNYKFWKANVKIDIKK
jgi:cellulose synthase/poly-beta-1,6-N-acetylglucosamine synthase-like glycosyltransferase